jgi:hypothetical protein
MAQTQVEPAPGEESTGVFGRLFGNLRTGARPVDASKVAQLLTPPTTPKTITIALSESSSPSNTVSSSASSCSSTLLISTCRRRVARRAASPHRRIRRTRRLALHTSSERALFAGRRIVPLAGVSFESSHRLCIYIRFGHLALYNTDTHIFASLLSSESSFWSLHDINRLSDGCGCR